MDNQIFRFFRSLNLERMKGRFIKLEILNHAHISELEKCFDPSLFDYYPKPYLSAREFVDENLQMQKQGNYIPFAIILVETSKAIGCIEYSSVDEKNRKLEIGGTWLASRFHGSCANSEAKFLLLRYAFEELNFVRTQFTANAVNARSRNAIEKIGAQFEGIMRYAMILPEGQMRDEAYYSIILDEWLEVKANLRDRIEAKSKKIEVSI